MFPRTIRAPSWDPGRAKDFRPFAQFWRGRQAFPHLSDRKGCAMFHLDHRLPSSGINSQGLGVLFAPGSHVCQSLWPRLLPGLFVWDALLPMPLNYKTKLVSRGLYPPVCPIAKSMPYPVSLRIHISSVKSRKQSSLQHNAQPLWFWLCLPHCYLVSHLSWKILRPPRAWWFYHQSLGFWTHSATQASRSYRESRKISL